MKKSMKANSRPTEPVGHPPVLEPKPDQPRSPPRPTERHFSEPHKQASRKGQKGSR